MVGAVLCEAAGTSVSARAGLPLLEEPWALGPVSLWLQHFHQPINAQPRALGASV